MKAAVCLVVVGGGVALAACGNLYRPAETLFKQSVTIEAQMEDSRICRDIAFEASRKAGANDGTPTGIGMGIRRGSEARTVALETCAATKGYQLRALNTEQREFLSDLPSELAKNRFLAVIGTGGSIEDYKRRFGSAS